MRRDWYARYSRARNLYHTLGSVAISPLAVYGALDRVACRVLGAPAIEPHWDWLAAHGFDREAGDAADIGEEIPLYAVFAARFGTITDEDIQWGRYHAKRLGMIQ